MPLAGHFVDPKESPTGTCSAVQITDGTSDRSFSDPITRRVTSTDSLTPAMRGNGGFVARLVPVAN